MASKIDLTAGFVPIKASVAERESITAHANVLPESASGCSDSRGSAGLADDSATVPKVTEDPPYGYIPGPAADKYLPRVLGFPRLPWHTRLRVFLWERGLAFLRKFYLCASRLRLTVVTESIDALHLGFRQANERYVQNAALLRLGTAINLDLGEEDLKCNKATLSLLVWVMLHDNSAAEEMRELQRLPLSLFALQARLAAIDDIAHRHWPSVRLTVERADIRAGEMMDALRRAHVGVSYGAHRATALRLLRVLADDAAFCSKLAACQVDPAEEVGGLIEAFIDHHLPEIVSRDLKKNGQPIPEAERSAMSSELSRIQTAS